MSTKQKGDIVDGTQEKDVSESSASEKKGKDFFPSLMIGMIILVLMLQGLHSSGSNISTKETSTTSTTSTISITNTTSLNTVFERFNITDDTAYIIHFVKDGESWASIVDTYGLTEYGFTYIDLAEYNGTHYSQMLYTGDPVSVPLLY